MGTSWFDYHCHLSTSRLSQDVGQAILQASCSQGLAGVFLAGVGPDEWQEQVDWASKIQSPFQVKHAWGFHPWWVTENEAKNASRSISESIETLSNWIQLHPPTALGEVGLDYSRAKTDAERAIQCQWVQAQFQLAQKLGLPVVIHSVRSHGPLLDLIDQAQFRNGGWVHSFQGSVTEAQALIDRGFTLSLGPGVLTWSEQRLNEFRVIPITNWVLESDSPDQKPRDFPGHWNHPTVILRIAERLGKVWGVEPSSLLRHTHPFS